jgi:methylthioribose-1-phosphate isomerase
MALAAIASPATDSAALLKDLAAAKAALDASRPTAVNLSWATSRLFELATLLSSSGVEFSKFREHILTEAKELADDDVRINKRLGDFGATLVKPGANLIHHCNTGALATVDYGTAIGVIYSAHHQGKKVHVWVDETRPRLQGARLTAWELMREGVPIHLMADSASGILMYNKKVDAVVFGADRVAANGDTANKIGTYKLAVVAKENNVPVYACVPTSTIDLTLKDGRGIPIEERGAEEVTHIGSECVAPAGCPVFNPAFDVTPEKYITAIVTEEGICYPPFEKSLPLAKQKSDERVKVQWQKRLQTYLQK